MRSLSYEVSTWNYHSNSQILINGELVIVSPLHKFLHRVRSYFISNSAKLEITYTCRNNEECHIRLQNHEMELFRDNKLGLR